MIENSLQIRCAFRTNTHTHAITNRKHLTTTTQRIKWKFYFLKNQTRGKKLWNIARKMTQEMNKLIAVVYFVSLYVRTIPQHSNHAKIIRNFHCTIGWFASLCERKRKLELFESLGSFFFSLFSPIFFMNLMNSQFNLFLFDSVYCNSIFI